MTNVDSKAGYGVNFAPYVVLALILCGVLYVRIRLLQIPLERDEGEYAYMGQLMLKGIPPYANAYTMKLPGVSACYALFMMMFGQTIAGIHLGLLIVNGISTFLVYLLAGRLLGKEAALISCAAYAVMSLSMSVLGVFAHATHFVAVCALSGFILLLHYIDRRRRTVLFLSGLCFGSAFLMKQHAALFICFAFFFLLWRRGRNAETTRYVLLAESAVLAAGTITPYAAVVMYAYQTGVSDKFWFWTVEYARKYVSEISLSQGWDYFYSNSMAMAKLQLPFLIMAGVGLVSLCSMRRTRADRAFLLGFFLFSLLAICPGWYFRPHYFIMLLPALALMAGAVADSSGYLFAKIKSVTAQRIVVTILLLAASGYAYAQERSYYVSLSPRQISRACYGLSPFPEAVLIADYIRDHTTPHDRIAVLGSEPEIFFYADRLSATGHLYMYGLMENQPYATRMQDEMIRDIETAKPKYLVMVNIASSWLSSTFSQGKIVAWGDKYASDNYEVAGAIDLFSYDATQNLSEENARNYKPMTDTFITILRRKEGI